MNLYYIYYFLIAIVFIFTVDITNTSLGYINSFIIFIVFVATLFLNKKMLKLSSHIDFIPLIFFFIWLYGFFMGILFENKTEYVIRNFAGMTLFLTYYILVNVKLSSTRILQFLFYISLINVIYGLIVGCFSIMSITMIDENSRFIFLANMTTYYIILAWGLFYLLGPVNLINKFNHIIYLSKFYRLLLVFMSTVVIFMSASKGFILAYILMIILSYILIFKKRIYRAIFSLPGFILIISFMVLAYKLGYINLILSIFDKNEVSNNTRYMQLEVMFNDLTFIGNGLGALVNGYDSVNTYGFEIVYINIIHKFGFMVIGVYLSYLYILYKIFRLSNKLDTVFVSMILFSNMMYLIPSLGNPMLFAPINVLLTVVTLVILKKLEINKRQKYVQK